MRSLITSLSLLLCLPIILHDQMVRDSTRARITSSPQYTPLLFPLSVAVSVTPIQIFRETSDCLDTVIPKAA